MSKHNRTITEAKVQQLSALKYGTDPIERLEKLKEEIEELSQALNNCEYDDGSISYSENEPWRECVRDELSDCLFVLISLIGIYDTNIREIVDIAIHKIKQREIEPNYKRDANTNRI